MAVFSSLIKRNTTKSYKNGNVVMSNESMDITRQVEKYGVEIKSQHETLKSKFCSAVRYIEFMEKKICKGVSV